MTEIAQAAPLSVYRGQSRTGVGEGPERTVQHGEQYLWVDSSLYKSEVLDAIRPWMTLDSDPADHQRVNDQLEGWSLFTAVDHLFVVRLASAGTYDRRAAYFAHARAWNIKTLPAGTDPGLYLGRTDAFDQPWLDASRAGSASADSVALWPEQVKAEPETAARFLGHLFQTLADNNGNPLIVAAPVSAFVSRGALHGLVCFTRGGLPAKFRQICRIRIYSRMPELFVRHLGANFVVVPEEAASAALTARPTATLLDRQGQKIAGKELDARALDYAAGVVERALAIPDGLPLFSERFQRRTPPAALPSSADTRTIQITYNVAFALGGPLERRGDVIQKYLPRAAAKLGPGLDWNRLIGDAWPHFPRHALLDELLTDSRDLSEGRLEFLRAVEEGAARLGLHADGRLPDWWDSNDAGKLHRLIELLAHEPPLVSNAAAAERTTGIELQRLAQCGPLRRVLQAEAASRSLYKRAHERAELAALAADTRVFEVLSRAVSDGLLDSGWAESYVQSAKREKLVEAARAWFGDARFWSGWPGVARLLLDRLRMLDGGFDETALLIDAGGAVDPRNNLEIYLRLADLFERIKAPEERNVLMPRLWEALPQLDSSRAYLESLAFDPQWRCLRLEALEITNVLALATCFEHEESFARLYEELDARMLRETEATTHALVQQGWWYFWRRQSRLMRSKPQEAAALRSSAFGWLTSEAWSDGRAEPTLEAWNKVLEDLPQSIAGETFADLRKSSERAQRPWPWIPPFEEEQLAEMIARAGDLGALAEIAEVILADETPPATSPREVLQRSRYDDVVSVEAFNWLVEGCPRQTLTLESSGRLCERAANRRDRALEARIDSLATHLEQYPMEALAVAGADLWADSRFLRVVAKWMSLRGSFEKIGADAAQYIEKHVRGELQTPVVPSSRALVQDLVNHRYNKAARLLSRDLQENTQKEIFADRVIHALLSKDAKHPCWQQLEKQFKHAKTAEGRDGRHPLLLIVDRIRERDLKPEQRSTLALHGWRTFEVAAEEHRDLMLASSHPTTGLPLFDFAASMLPPGAMGQAALQIIFARANRGLREDVQWWRSLLRAIRDYRRYGGTRSADDREETALAAILGYVDRDGERNAVSEALKAEARNSPEWDVLSEFEMRAS